MGPKHAGGIFLQRWCAGHAKLRGNYCTLLASWVKYSFTMHFWGIIYINGLFRGSCIFFGGIQQLLSNATCSTVSSKWARRDSAFVIKKDWNTLVSYTFVISLYQSLSVWYNIHCHSEINVSSYRLYNMNLCCISHYVYNLRQSMVKWQYTCYCNHPGAMITASGYTWTESGFLDTLKSHRQAQESFSNLCLSIVSFVHHLRYKEPWNQPPASTWSQAISNAIA